jgi:hypothetical protein
LVVTFKQANPSLVKIVYLKRKIIIEAGIEHATTITGLQTLFYVSFTQSFLFILSSSSFPPHSLLLYLSSSVFSPQSFLLSLSSSVFPFQSLVLRLSSSGSPSHSFLPTGDLEVHLGAKMAP